MKRTLKYFAALACVLMFSSAALAAPQCNTTSGNAGDSFTVTDGKTPAATLEFQSSPGVVACYYTDAAQTAGAKQWYALGTFHTGGTTAYATASNFTNVYTKDIESIEVKTVANSLSGIAETAASAGDWTGWAKK